jgi:sugar/nucleoside kinase (ribokinase family)
MSILCVGSVALDSVETPFGKRDNILGGSATHFSVSASFQTEVQLVAVVGEDFPQEHLDFLKERKVDVSGLEVATGKTFRWKGEYGYDLNEAKTLETHLNVFAGFTPKIPQAWKSPEYLFLGNIHPDLQRQVVESVEKPGFIALDTMNFWIEGEPESLKKTISLVDLVVINEAECRQLAEEASLVKAARTIMSWGPKIVVAKQGEYGALLFQGEQVFSAPGFPLEQVMDPTGAGDSFAGGMMGYLSTIKDPLFGDLRQAVIMGSVMASFNVEDFSCDRLRSLTWPEIQARYNSFQDLAHFEPLPNK